MDEVRVWNYARTQAEIASSMNSEIVSATGSARPLEPERDQRHHRRQHRIRSAINGTLVNGPVWTTGYPPRHPPGTDGRHHQSRQQREGAHHLHDRRHRRG